MYSFNIEKFKRNQIVFKQGDIPKAVYIVKEGEFEVTHRQKCDQADQKMMKPEQVRTLIGPHDTVRNSSYSISS